MTICKLLFNLPSQVKTLIRAIEKTNRIFIDITNSQVFNKTYVRENLLHDCVNKYIDIYRLINDGCLHFFNYFYNYYCCKSYLTNEK